MPLFFVVGQHLVLVAMQERLQGIEWIFALVDDIYIFTKPERVGAVHVVLQEELFKHAHIRINGGMGVLVGHLDFVRAQLESLRWLTFSPFGHCWCIVLRLGPVASCNMMGISEDSCQNTVPLVGQAGLIRCTWCKSAILVSSATSSHSWRGFQWVSFGSCQIS